jgi:hypothetical protein
MRMNRYGTPQMSDNRANAIQARLVTVRVWQAGPESG